jgi:hypothetical protein
VQVNHIRQALNRRTEAEQMLVLLAEHPSMMPQRGRKYSIIDMLHGAAVATADINSNMESQSSC